MIWSFNETEAMARKAARGAGLTWGLAEEAGSATRWLAGAGLKGPELLVGLLRRNDGTSYEALMPVIEDGVWRAKGGMLCPLVAGATLCDRSAELCGGDPVRMGATSYPALLIPYADAAARQGDCAVTIEWPGVSVSVDSDGLHVEGEADALYADAAQEVTITTGKADVAPLPRPTQGPEISREVAKTLEDFAHRTYAPATEESRLSGAGAGLSDND